MKVLLGIGGSDDSLLALDRTVERTAVTGDDLTIAVLENPDSVREAAAIDQAIDEALGEADIDAEIRYVEGDPGSRLVEIAESDGYDEIVLGGGHTSRMGKISIGSIAEFVLLNANTTVTLVR